MRTTRTRPQAPSLRVSTATLAALFAVLGASACGGESSATPTGGESGAGGGAMSGSGGPSGSTGATGTSSGGSGASTSGSGAISGGGAASGTGASSGSPGTTGSATGTGATSGASSGSASTGSSGSVGGRDAGAAETDATTVEPDAGKGNPSSGAGSDNVSATAANRAVCTPVALTTSAGGAQVCPGGGAGPNCFQCLFGGTAYNTTSVATAQATQEAGNYAVTINIGGAAAGQTQINAEANRLLLGPVSTVSGQSLTYQFAVNVRAKEGQPDEAVPAGYPGLDLFLSGPMSAPPEVSAIGFALASSVGDKPVMVYVASDSTACDQTDTDYAGWGQMLPQYFDYPVDIANYADSGESSASFLAGADRWGAVDAALTTGNWVLIQFGHNDKTTTSADFQANITKMVTEARAKGATPVLLSPPARATFSGATLSSQASLHSADMAAVATAQKVAYIDLTTITTAWYNQIGPNAWQAFHALGTDMTHTNAAGATKIAGYVSAAISSQGIGLATYLRH